MSQSISFRCSGCNARIKAPYQLMGRSRSCPGCGHRFVVKAQPPEEQGPVLVPPDPPEVRLVLRNRLAG